MDKLPSKAALEHASFVMAGELADELVKCSSLFFTADLDASGMDRLRSEARRQNRIAPTYTAFVVKAVSHALRRHPHLNCMIRETPFSRRRMPLPDVTATVAVERDMDGVSLVFAPQLRDSDACSLAELTAQLAHYGRVEIESDPRMRQFMGLVKLCRWLPRLAGILIRMPRRSLTLWRKYRGGSFAVTSPGKYGGCDGVLPPWPWPLTVAFGAVKVRPWVENNALVARKTMRLTIAADRRLAHGAPLARFAEDVRQLLERPERLEGSRETEAPSFAAAASAAVAREAPAGMHMPAPQPTAAEQADVK